MKFEFSRQIFDKSSSIKFYQNPSNGSRVVPCGQTDMTKLRVTFRNFANAPKNAGRCELWKKEDEELKRIRENIDEVNELTVYMQ
jgi:hypothetical protein